MEKEMTFEEVIRLVNEQEGDFIICVSLLNEEVSDERGERECI